MPAALGAVSVHLPAGVLSNSDLAAQFPEWSVDRIAAKTGIRSRHIAGADEYSSDLAVGAGRALESDHGVHLESMDYLIVCTQTPDHYLPSTSLIVHEQLDLRQDCGATDITLGCSGYVYALGLARGLVDSEQAERVLVITTDTYSRLLNPADKGVRTLFGDAAAASVVERCETGRGIHSFVYGSDGSGGGSLVVPNGGLRPGARYASADPAARGLRSNGFDLYMNGPEIFNFTLRAVPDCVDRVLQKAHLHRDQIDTWVFHQANAFMLEHLRKRLDIPSDRFVIELEDIGNTVSSTIPIALSRAAVADRLEPGTRSLLLGFGVGLSWGGAIVDW